MTILKSKVLLPGDGLKVSIVQPSLDPFSKYENDSVNNIEEVLLELSKKYANSDLIVWPESPFPYLNSSPQMESLHNRTKHLPTILSGSWLYKDNNLQEMLSIINGTSSISLRIVDWFSTNYSKKNFTIYKTKNNERFKVYEDYKLKLKAYSKKRFDPFCRWDRIKVPITENSDYCFETTIGQLNFFKWALENKVIDYIINNYSEIEIDMNKRNSTSKRNKSNTNSRKKREELSISASKTIKKELIEITVKFD